MSICCGGLSGYGGGSVPLLRLKVAVICALDLAGFHEHLRRRAVDALLEACLPSVSVFVALALGSGLPVHDMAAIWGGFSYPRGCGLRYEGVRWCKAGLYGGGLGCCGVRMFLRWLSSVVVVVGWWWVAPTRPAPQ